MLDPKASRRGPFTGFMPAAGSAVIKESAPAARFVFRGAGEAAAAAGTAFGVALPAEACRAATAAGRAALWLGPDEWLLQAEPDDAESIAAAMAAGLGDLPHSLVDVSHRQTGLSVSGLRAADVLNSGCPLDLDAEAFPIGMCTRTILGKAEVILWRVAPAAFEVQCWRSFGAYVLAYLEEARLEYEV